MKKKTMAALIGTGMFFSMGVGAFAASNLQPIQAFLNTGMKFQVNGQAFTPAEAPITYKNTTYLPLRSVADALDIPVRYNAASNLIQLGEQSQGVALAVGFSDMYHTKDPNKTVYGGKDYKEVYLNDSSGSRGGSFMLYPKKKYSTLVLQAAAIGKDIEKLTVQDSDTDIELKSTSVSLGEGLKTITVDISGSNSLYINAELKDGGKFFVPLTTSYFK
ncbi:stalk domain-containing protein [Saccharibacillus sp. CPCC 101409]|uniref:stalk domain-containing protein n=1 Tax=Saccharibacillus sp. CPCC 101409 TaxID=3058041 RepID=UPI0026741168|nr:stalk domain-containing protein [Saccharibacillus sp. CPCC 101409]MDO3410390.1 stalk domain-containing protein [Saccharibacillus sp. CPCC 101409]